jgi:hypothetical protein
VVCGGGRVTALALYALPDVSARVPPALGDLAALEILQVDSVPGLSGPVPASFANLTRLRDLDVNGTSVSGPVPGALLAGADSLSTLVIANSKLAGPIPASLASLPNLRYLDLSGKLLTGAIPPGLLHGGFRFLLLSNNRLTGEIPADGGGGDVDTFDLSRNQLTGDPSPFLFGITRPAAKIDLSWNRLEFDMTGVRFPHHLRFLDLSHNRVTGRVAKSLMDGAGPLRRQLQLQPALRRDPDGEVHVGARGRLLRAQQVPVRRAAASLRYGHVACRDEWMMIVPSSKFKKKSSKR